MKFKGERQPLQKSDLTEEGGEEQGLVARALSQILGNTAVLCLKTQNFHWNVEGSRFVAMHHLTEKQYLNLFEAMDRIAERIRSLGFYAPGSMHEFLDVSFINEPVSMPISEVKMLADLAEDHVMMTKALKEAIGVAENDNDTTTIDLLSARRQFHEQAAWMLKSLMK